jgi:soluble lytic murein transglycosylase-like protein
MNRMVEAVKRLRKASHKAEARKPASAATAASSAVKSPETYGVSQSTLDAIAACESGGDPSAVSAGGIYRGLYQFDQATWESVGGTGDPAAASPAEQSMRAAMLYSQSGSSPWPVCG